MLYKTKKNNGKYYVEYEEKILDITDFVEHEIELRDEINHDLKFFFEDNKQKTSELIELKTRYNTLQKHMMDLMNKSERVADDWFARGECYGSALILRRQINALKKWLEQIKK